jgi:hypothetical protein
MGNIRYVLWFYVYFEFLAPAKLFFIAFMFSISNFLAVLNIYINMR